MTSKLIVNSLAADTGVSTITFADQAKMGNSLFHSTGFTIGDSFLHSTGVNITNINATGVITATKFVGEVSVGSSITFEDNEKAYFGTGTDFSIYHNGSASYLDETGTGGLIVKTDTAFQVFNSAGSQPAFTVTPGGGIDLYHNTTKMLETTAIGLTINGDVNVGGATITNPSGSALDFNGSITASDVVTAGALLHEGDTDTLVHFSAANTIELKTGGFSRLSVTNSGVSLQNNTTFNVNGGRIILGDSTGGANDDRIVLGNSNDCFLYHDSTNSYIENNTGHLRIGNTHNSSTIKFFTNNSTRWNIDGSGHFVPDTNNAVDIGSTGEGVKDIYVETSVKMSGAAPLQFEHNGNTTSAKKTVIYSNYNNTSNHAYNGLLVEMGHITDSTAGEIRKFTIGERGGPTNVIFDQNGIHFGGGSLNPTLNADNGLDDYEEGSFSPTLVNGNNGYRFQQGTYTKIGNLVTFTAYIETSATPPSGNLVFGSLPFTSISGRSWVFPFHTNRTSFGTASFDARAYMGGNATTIIIYYPVNSSSSNFQPINQNGMNAANASAVWISGSYQTSS